MIQLTEKEQELFNLLLSVIKATNRSTILRVAGGWVRDKLLQKESHDIDIALDDQSGLEFAMSVNEYLKEHGMETRTIAVIQVFLSSFRRCFMPSLLCRSPTDKANPDQSKHLETVNLKVLGFEIDFVHLRTETYADSRIPQVQRGTAEEDAMRRDFTINALFFNLNTAEVEDFTNRGRQDLQQRILRTPIDPLITFKDDPLRILRAIRFAGRLLFTLDPELIAAAQDREIKQALLEKVSRERIYKECEGMLNHHSIRPALSFFLIYMMDILDAILPVDNLLSTVTAVIAADARDFNPNPWTRDSFPQFVQLPQSSAGLISQESWKRAAIEIVHWIQLLSILRQSSYQTNVISSEDQIAPLILRESGAVSAVKSLYWAGTVISFAGLAVIEKKKETPLYVVLLREGLKMENQTLKNVATLIDTAKRFMMIADADSLTIDVAASLLRASKELWRESLLLAAAYTLSLYHPIVAFPLQPADDFSTWFPTITLNENIMNIVSRFAAIERKILNEFRLDEVWNLKPFLDGSQLLQRLGLSVKGPIVGKLMEEQILWQIRHLHQSDATVEQCLEHLQQFLQTQR